MSDKIKTIRIHGILKAVSLLTHNSGTSGNETIVNQEPVLYKGSVVQAPIISGNALRHRCIREPGSLWLIKQIGLYGQANVDQLNFLLNGGSLTKSGTSDNMKIIAKLQELFPLIRLLGGCLPNQIINGSLICKRGILICAENLNQIAEQVPDELQFPVFQINGAQSFIGKYQYTRGDATKHKDFFDAVDDLNDEKSDSQLMIYSGQAIVPGSLFWNGFVLQNVSQLEFGALFHSLHEWDASGATIGGSQRVGHGQIEMSVHVEDSENVWDIGESVAAYIQHVSDTKDEAVSFLREVFP